MGAAVQRGVCARALLLLAFAAAAHSAAATPTTSSLTLNATQLDAAGDWLLVSWQVSSPQPSDFVALVPAADDGRGLLASSSPLKILPTGGTTRGAHVFRMLNWRTPVRWLLLRGGLAAPSLLAQSDVVSWRWPNEPTGVHLAPTGRASEMSLQWTSHDESSPHVFWRSETGAHGSAAANTTVLRRSSLCGDAQVTWRPSRPHELSSNATGMGWFDPGKQHTAVMTNLSYGARLFYALGNASGPLSPERSFVMPPPPGCSATLRFAVAADFGVEEPDGSNYDNTGRVASMVEVSMRGWDNRPAKDTLARLVEEVDAGASLVILNGDISYARGFGAIWESFMHAISSVAARVGLLTSIGNHESCWPGTASAWNTSSLDSGGECGVVYAHRFVMPAPATLATPWFSFTSGPVHFVHVSTEHDLSNSSLQLAWLRADLSAARRRADVPWIVLSGHRFFYVSSSSPNDAAAGRALLDGGLEALMLQFGVDLVLTGHHHSYQRTCPVNAGKCVPLRSDGSAAAPVHIVGGHAGAGTGGLAKSRPPIVQHVGLEHGYLRGVANATHLVVTSRSSTNGSTLDELVLFKPPRK